MTGLLHGRQADRGPTTLRNQTFAGSRPDREHGAGGGRADDRLAKVGAGLLGDRPRGVERAVGDYDVRLRFRVRRVVAEQGARDVLLRLLVGDPAPAHGLLRRGAARHQRRRALEVASVGHNRDPRAHEGGTGVVARQGTIG